MRTDIHTTKLHRKSDGLLLVASCVVASAMGCDGGNAERPGIDPRYMGSVSIASPDDSWSSYMALVSGVNETTDATLRQGLETTGWVIPYTRDGAIYVPGGSVTPTVTKYRADDNGRLTEAGVVSFAGLGITWVWQGPHITSDKAYLFDDAGYRAVIWNPTTMELTGREIDLRPALSQPILDKPGYTVGTQSNLARQRGNRLFVPVRWANWNAVAPDPMILPAAGLLVIDTEKDAVVALLQDDRLADTIYTVMTGAGDIYLFTGAFGVSFQKMYGNSRPGGALRVRNGEERFDPGYYLNLDETVGNRPASTPVLAGGTSVYLKAFYEDRQPITDEIRADPFSLIGKQAWRYWKVDLEGREPAQEMADIPWTSTDGFFYELPDENRLFIGVMAEGFASTRLYEATATGFTESIDVTGALTTISALQRRGG